MNIKFHYLYRDGGNFKQYHHEVFSNRKGYSIEHLDTVFKNALIDRCWFYAKKWQLKDLREADFNIEVDPDWHEYDYIEGTQEEVTSIDIDEFTAQIPTSHL